MTLRDPRTIARNVVRALAGAEPSALRANLRRAVREPALTVRWLKRARKAQLTLALLLPCLLLLPSALDRVLPAVYPDRPVEKKVLGIFPRTEHEPDPRIPIRKRQLIALAWIATGCTTMILLVRRLQDAVAAPGEPTVVETVVDLPSPGPTSSAGNAAARPPGDGKLPDRYRVEREIARGGMGVVYAARDRVLERDVALKEVATVGIADPEEIFRFRREAQALARLTHPNIVQVYDLVEDAERLWMVMELVEGESLAEMLSRRGSLAPEDAARIGSQVAQGLAFAHSRGVIHRDVKPGNVLVTRDGVAKVADFGVARMTDAGTRTLPGQVVGSPHYLSPEQASGKEADERSDVYSMGVMMFEMLSGRRPFEGDLMSLLSQHLTQPPPDLPRVGDASGKDLGSVVLRMLEKDPARRPATMDETGRLLRSFCGAALER